MTSLEIVNEFIKSIEDTMKQIKSGPWYDLRLLDLNKFKKIKQDLEAKQKLEIKLNGFIQLIKDLFNEIEINCEPEYYTNNYGEEACEDVCTIKHNYHYFHITEELFDTLWYLKKGCIKEDKVGDSQ